MSKKNKKQNRNTRNKQTITKKYIIISPINPTPPATDRSAYYLAALSMVNTYLNGNLPNALLLAYPTLAIPFTFLVALLILLAAFVLPGMKH